MVYFPYICIDKIDIRMKVHEINDYYRQASNLENVYKTEKSIGQLIRNHRFTYKNTRYGDYYDLKYKVTYIKTNHKNYDLLVNVKVCGTMGSYWRSAGPICVTEYCNKTYNSPRRRNEDIRRSIADDVRNFFRLFGMDTYRVEVGKVTVSKEL